MQIDLGMSTQKTGSTEDKGPEPADCENYEKQVRELMTDKKIDPRAVFMLDEYNDFKYLPPKIVVTSRKERESKGPSANQKWWATQWPKISDMRLGFDSNLDGQSIRHDRPSFS